MDTNKCTNKHESENKCCDYESLVAARSVAEKLKIPFYVMDASKEFKKEVIDYFIKEYDNGRTPNPCVVCNKEIKFGWMLEQAKKLGCEFIATGHYSRIVRQIPNDKPQISNKSQISGLKSQTRLLQARDKKKDQTYFLWQLDQEQLSHILFPIGDYIKEEVRKLAKEWKLPSANKKESQDLCFISTADKADFIRNYADKLNKSGIIVDKNGNTLGKHNGLCHYTVGQREGLGVQLIANRVSRIADRKDDSSTSFGTSKQLAISNKQTSGFQPAYVLRLDVEKNQLVVGFREDLDSHELIAEKVNWINQPIANGKSLIANCQAKIRYGSINAECRIQPFDFAQGRNAKLKDQIKVVFDKPQRAVTPGQSIVFYDKEDVLGGGIIL